MTTLNTRGFDALGLPVELCNRLTEYRITEPTPIQERAIPVALTGSDLIGLAQTGTGKTLAFALPLIVGVRQGHHQLVLAPTRELAQQIAETFLKLRVRACVVVGGASMYRQIKELRCHPQVIVATPGRLLDHMEQGTVRLNRVSHVVLDEADQMLDMGFAPAIKRILDQTPENRQTLLFSATMPPAILDLAKRYLVDPQKVEAPQTGSAPELVEQELIYVPHEEKPELLRELLYENKGSILVFARTRHGARKLAASIRKDGHTAAEIHADRTLAQRRQALDGFKAGDYRILVATDIAARGIDVKQISLVINYDVPEKPEDYLHRIGRTGRAGATGRAIMIGMPAQAKDIRDIERLMGEKLKISSRSTSIPNTVSRADTRPAREDGAQPAKPQQGGDQPRWVSKQRNTGKPHNRKFGAPRPGGQHSTGRPAQGRPAAQSRPAPVAETHDPFRKFHKKRK